MIETNIDATLNPHLSIIAINIIEVLNSKKHRLSYY